MQVFFRVNKCEFFRPISPGTHEIARTCSPKPEVGYFDKMLLKLQLTVVKSAGITRSGTGGKGSKEQHGPTTGTVYEFIR